MISYGNRGVDPEAFKALDRRVIQDTSHLALLADTIHTDFLSEIAPGSGGDMSYYLLPPTSYIEAVNSLSPSARIRFRRVAAAFEQIEKGVAYLNSAGEADLVAVHTELVEKSGPSGVTITFEEQIDRTTWAKVVQACR